MALDFGSFQSNCVDTFSNEQLGPIAANKITNNLVTYWSGGTGGTDGILAAITAQPLLLSGFLGLFSGFSPSVSIAAGIMATTIDSAFKIIPIAGATFGTGTIVTTDQGGLKSALETAMTSPPTRQTFAINFANAVAKYTTSALCTGSGVPPFIVTPPQPFVPIT